AREFYSGLPFFMGHKKQEGAAMKVILATRNRYLEYGLQALLKGHSVILAREFFLPENRRYIPDFDESWLIIS
ncbi:hypothetical protein FV293_30130, partial [Escherichia coli]